MRAKARWSYNKKVCMCAPPVRVGVYVLLSILCACKVVRVFFYNNAVGPVDFVIYLFLERIIWKSSGNPTYLYEYV